MKEISEEAKAQFFEEVGICLKRGGFQVGPVEEGFMPVFWQEAPLCRVNGVGGVRYRSEVTRDPGSEAALNRAMDIVDVTEEYMRLLEKAPRLNATGLDESYKCLNEFNSAVLAAHHIPRHGWDFVTWCRDYSGEGVTQGHYVGGDYEGAKRDFYGFGMKYDNLNKRDNVVDNYCVNWYTNQMGETYTPVPYYFVPDKYGLFVDSTFYSRFDMCAERDDVCVIEVRADGTEGFSVPLSFFVGDNAQIAAAYSRKAGKAELPPVWAFGPWISANEWNCQSEIMEQLEKSLENQISTSVIVIEAWSDEETFYTFNDSKFETVNGEDALRLQDFTFSGRWPDPKGMVDKLHDNGVKCVLWQIPVLKYSTSATAQSLRDQVYATDMGYVLKCSDGSVYRLPSGTWFGNSLLVDFTNPDAAKWFLEKRRYLLEDLGIDGFKTDGGEFVWGRDVTAYDGRTGLELRNAYPDLYAQAYYDFANRLRDGAITFSRAGGSSMQTQGRPSNLLPIPDGLQCAKDMHRIRGRRHQDGTWYIGVA